MYPKLGTTLACMGASLLRAIETSGIEERLEKLGNGLSLGPGSRNLSKRLRRPKDRQFAANAARALPCCGACQFRVVRRAGDDGKSSECPNSTSQACPIALRNRLSQVHDSAMPAGCSAACPQTQETVEKLGRLMRSGLGGGPYSRVCFCLSSSLPIAISLHQSWVLRVGGCCVRKRTRRFTFWAVAANKNCSSTFHRRRSRTRCRRIRCLSSANKASIL